MDYKIAIIGNKDAVQGFRAFGVEARPVLTNEEAENAIQEMYTANKYAIIFITEEWADRIRNFLDELPPRALPSVVAVPSHRGSTGAGLHSLKRIVEQAVGSDILN